MLLRQKIGLLSMAARSHTCSLCKAPRPGCYQVRVAANGTSESKNANGSVQVWQSSSSRIHLEGLGGVWGGGAADRFCLFWGPTLVGASAWAGSCTRSQREIADQARAVFLRECPTSRTELQLLPNEMEIHSCAASRRMCLSGLKSLLRVTFTA